MSKKATLVLKKEYQNKVVTKKMPPFGEVTLDTNRVTAEEYPNYVRLGFSECFEEVEEVSESVKMIEELKTKMKKTELGDLDTEEGDLDTELGDLDTELEEVQTPTITTAKEVKKPKQAAPKKEPKTPVKNAKTK